MLLAPARGSRGITEVKGSLVYKESSRTGRDRVTCLIKQQNKTKFRAAIWFNGWVVVMQLGGRSRWI